VARGLSNSEIANTMFMLYATAKPTSADYSPSCARDRAQLVILAYESGVVSPGAST
jgi:hypothetical protein